jgi:hypothetical protein
MQVPILVRLGLVPNLIPRLTVTNITMASTTVTDITIAITLAAMMAAVPEVQLGAIAGTAAISDRGIKRQRAISIEHYE